MLSKATQVTNRLEELIKAQFQDSSIKLAVKTGIVQFYLKTVFSSEGGDNDLLICILPSEDKANVKARRFSHNPYRLQVRIISRRDVSGEDGGFEDLQEAVHMVRLAYMPKHDDHNPFDGLSPNNAFEAFSTKYPTPDINIPVVSAVMTLEINFTENIN